MIFLPEIPFDIQQFIRRVDELQKHKKSVVIAVSEGIRVPDGRYVCDLTDHLEFKDDFGHTILYGTARYLSDRIYRELGCKTRAIEFNTLQPLRCTHCVQGGYYRSFSGGGSRRQSRL